MIKNIALFAFAASILVVACQPPAEEGGIKEKKEQLKAAKKELAALKKKITKLQDEIDAADTTNANGTGVLVSTIALEPMAFSHYVDVQGTAESESNVLVSSEIGGAVGKVVVSEGDKVGKGQLLVMLDDKVIMNNMEELRTSLELASSVYEKQKNLWDQKIGSEIQFLQAKNNKESLEKKLNTLNAQLDKSRMKSPINGVVDEVFVKEGEMTGPGTPIVRVVNLEDIYLKADVSEIYVSNFKKGDSVDVTFPSLGTTARGRLDAIGQFINPNNRTFRIEVKVSNKDGVLKPNLLAIIKMNDYQSDSAIVVPTKYISKAEGQHYVYVVDSEDGSKIARQMNVVVGKTYDGVTEVKEGLSSSHTVITEGSSVVVDGEEIKIQN